MEQFTSKYPIDFSHAKPVDAVWKSEAAIGPAWLVRDLEISRVTHGLVEMHALRLAPNRADASLDLSSRGATVLYFFEGEGKIKFEPGEEHAFAKGTCITVPERALGKVRITVGNPEIWLMSLRPEGA